VRGGIAALVLTVAVRGQSLVAAGGLLEIWIAVTAIVIVLWGLEIQGAVSSGDETAKRSVRDLLAGRLALYFYGGTLVVGLVVPLILPVAAEYGIHPVHLGIVFLATMQLGYLTPPVGLNLFVSSYRFNQSIVAVYLATWPFLLMLAAAVLLITFWPDLSLFALDP